MRILLVSNKADGAWFVWLLGDEGHEVDWYCESEKDANALSGIIKSPLKSLPNPGKYDLVVFDSSGLGQLADEARETTPVIGASEFSDRLEYDREFGLEVMEAAGIKVPKWEKFGSPTEALSFLKSHNKRYVLKPIGDAPSESTYVAKSAEDLAHFIEVRLDAKVKRFILQEFVEGVEVSTEAWWTGKEWVALNHTLEEKKFMTGGLGPNTGCAGNVVWMPPRRTPIFEQGLEKVGPILKEAGYVGMVDLNTIATEGNVWGLEWTPRFGYEGTCNLVSLLAIGFGEFLFKMATGQISTLGEAQAKFAATVRLSVPPYPFAEIAKKQLKVPIEGLDIDHLEQFVLYDAMVEDGCLVTSGTYNAIGCPIGTGATIGSAFTSVEAILAKLNVPDLQYRNDLRECIERRYNQLERWGWLRGIG